MYATLADMLARSSEDELRALSDPTGIAEAIDAARVEEALRAATDRIDSYLRRRYAVPLATPPASIVDAACVLAKEWLADANPSTIPTESMVSRRKETIRWLEGLASGPVTIEGLATVAASQSAGARVSDRERSFGDGRRRIL